MCVQSVISDYFGAKHPNFWSQSNYDYVKDLLDRAGEVDKKLGEPECVDPEKEKWMREVEKRLEKLERSGN